MAEHDLIWVELNGQYQCNVCRANEHNGGLDQPCPWRPAEGLIVDVPGARPEEMVTANLDFSEAINFHQEAEIYPDGRTVLTLESVEPRGKDAAVVFKDSLGRTYAVVMKAKELYKQVKSARDEGRGRLRTSRLDARRRR